MAAVSELGREARRTNQAADSAELLNVKQVAQLMSCGERTVHRMSDLGKMPAPVKIGGLVRWPRRVLVEWINAGCPVIRKTPQAA
jgi:excisionase family DNA binding protein